MVQKIPQRLWKSSFSQKQNTTTYFQISCWIPGKIPICNEGQKWWSEAAVTVSIQRWVERMWRHKFHGITVSGNTDSSSIGENISLPMAAVNSYLVPVLRKPANWTMVGASVNKSQTCHIKMAQVNDTFVMWPPSIDSWFCIHSVQLIKEPFKIDIWLACLYLA